MIDISREIEKLRKSSLVYDHPDYAHRLAFVDQLLETLKKKSRTQIYRLPEGIKDSDKYIRAVRNLFPIQSPLKIPKESMNFDQVNDVQLDWIVPEKDTLVVLPEFHKLWKNEEDFFYTVMSKLLTRSYEVDNSFRFLVTLEKTPQDLFDHLHLYVGKKDARTDIARSILSVAGISRKTI